MLGLTLTVGLRCFAQLLAAVLLVVTTPALASHVPTPAAGTSSSASRVTSTRITVSATCQALYTPIYAIQGSGATSPLENTAVTLQGVVTGDFQGSIGQNGFYLQDATGDGSAATSDGIFVFVPAANPLSSVDVAVGDVVRVSGTVKEFQGLTEIDNVAELTGCGPGTPLTATPVTLPETMNDQLEQFEGMLVSFNQALTVAHNFFLGRYGQVTLASEGRLYTPTNLFDAGTPQAVAQANANARRLIVLDDGKSSQNPDPIPYFGADNTLRAGDFTNDLTGVLDFGPINSNSAIRDYRIQPTQPVTFTRSNERSTTPAPVGGNAKVASFNVLNYFTTLDQPGAACFPSGTRADCRGADSAAELARQHAKIVAALLAIDADVVGLIEIENNGNTATQDLINGLNAATSPSRYAAIATPNPGTDAIKVAMIYQPARMTPIGAAANYQTSDPVYGDELFDRPPLAQTFQHKATGEALTVVVNHFKSKSSCPASGPDADQGDGQGCWNAKRTRQAAALLAFVANLKAAAGDNDVLVIGDLNAYGLEDPIQVLTNAGLVNEIAQFVGGTAYSYIFDGQSGYLDHALVTASLDRQVVGVTVWHINADEPSVIDYNTEFKPQDLYTATPYRSSDHDPVIVGLDLGARSALRRLFLPVVLNTD